MKTLNLLFSTVLELSQAIEQEALRDDASLLIQLFVETPDEAYIEGILAFFREKFPLAKLIGATSDGVIAADEVYVESKNVAVFSYFEQTELRLQSYTHEEKQKSSFECGREVAKELCSEDTKLMITFADGLHTNGEDYTQGIAIEKPEVVVAGGLAGDNGKLQHTYVFTKERIISEGVVAVSLDSDVLQVNNGYTFDWKPIGKTMLVTKSVKNRVYELDNTPIVEVYAKYMGREFIEELPKIGIEFPLILEEDGVLVGRAPVVKHSDGSLTFAGNIEEGTEVRFGVGNISEILRSGNYNIHKIASQCSFETESIFVYSCMARRRFLQEQISEELHFLSTISPVSGFFTYGEFFHSQHSNQLLNETMTMILLSESDKPSKTLFMSEPKHYHPITSEQVIAHLANTVSQELEAVNRNLEQRVQASASLIRKQAFYDKLTGLPNRLKLISRLKESIGKTIVLINIDDFTIINDFYGHSIGDDILRQLAKLLEKYVSIHNMELFKLPSDEYAVIADIEHDESSIKAVMRDFLTLINYHEFLVEGTEIGVTVTIAAAFINKEGSGLINSDMALKLAKKAGKSVMIYDEDLHLSQEYAKNIETANLIKNAIDKDKIVPYFQPIFDIHTRKIEKYESLIRLIKEDGSVVSPFFFLDVAQKIKLYPKLTHIMIEKSFKYFARNGLNFSINLAFSDIMNENTKRYLFNKIEEYAIAKQLTIEILETQEIENESVVFSFIEKVYELGAQIAIDDFGSGFANFEYMTKNRSDIMKIDGSLIKNVDKDENARLVVETIVSFAKKLHKKTIAEFVHSKEVFDIVQEIGVDYVQGYYLGEPKPQV